MAIKKYSGEGSAEYSIDLLTQMLIEYPMINNVNIDLQSSSLEMTFLIKVKITEEKLSNFKMDIFKKIKIFNKLCKNENFTFKLFKENYNKVTKLKLISQLENLNESKIDFVIKRIKEEYESDLLIEKTNSNLFKKSSIEDLLLKAKREKNDKYFGFREKNKIFIYDTTS
ncbi:MAG: hypothetical protein ACQERJ_03030 [Bacillota bacterium]